MAKYLQLPDGNSLKVPDNMSYEEAMSLAQTKFPDLFSTAPKQATSGLKAAASAGASRLKGQAALTAAKLGVMDVAEAEKYQKEKEAEAAARFTPTEKGWTEDFGLKFRETLGGSLPSMVAPAAAGLAALALPVSAPVALGAGLLGAGAVSTGQFTGSNLVRQMDTGKTLEQASLGKAAAAAVPQALIDTAAMALLPGVGKLFGSVGSKLTTEQAKAIASQTLGKAAMDYTAKTGMAMGREGITEVAQQTLERLQAGLNIADPEARKEYIDSFIGGAVLGGTLAPAGRYIERSGAQTQAAKAEREERSVLAQQAAEQQRAAKQEEEALRQTPDHALRVGQEYDTLLAEFQARKAALKTPGKDATPVEKAEYADAQKAIKEINAQLKDIVPEYRRTAPIRARAEQEQAAAAEQARTAGMSPMEYMVDQTPEVTDTPFTPAEPDLAGYTMPEPAIRSYVPPPAAYAQERLQLAQDQAVEPDAATYTSYLMQDVGMARAVLDDADVVLPKGVRRELAKAVPAQEAVLRLQDAAARKQSTAASQQRLASVEEEEQASLEEQRAQAERDAEEAKLAPGVGSEIMALRRIAANPTGDVKDEGVLSTKVDRLVDVLLSGGPTPVPAGRLVAGATTTDASSADMLRAQLAYALATENKPRVNEIKKQLSDLNEPDTERSAGDLEFGEAAKESGVEGRLSQDAMKANRVTRLSNTQLSAFDRLADFVQRVREGNQEVSDVRKQTLRNAAEKLKDTVAGLALNEIDARRVQAGLPELGAAEKTKLVGQVSQTLNELIERGAGIFQKPVERKAQMRGSKIVLGADEDVQQPQGRRVFNNYEAAIKALRGQMRSDIDAIGGFVPAEGAAPRPERKPQRVVPLLKPQRPGFSDRDVGQQFVAAYDRAKSDEDYRALKDIESKFGKLSEAAQDEALVQVRRVENGMPLEIRGTLKDELADLRAAGVSDTGQSELFAGDTEKASTRTTPQRFLAFLDSQKVQGLRAKLAEENRVLAFQEKRAATIAKKVADETAKAEAAAQKILASNARTPAQKAKDALDRLVGPESKVTQALQIAESVRAPREAARARIRGMLNQIEDAERRAKKQVADIQELINYTNNKLTELTAKSGSGVEPSMNEIAMWTQARDNQMREIKKAQKVLDAVQKSLKAAQATQVRVIEDHASDTIGNALIKEGEKAQRKYDAAKTALEKAVAEESAALRTVKAEQKKPAPAAKTPEEQVLERLGPAARVEKVERVYRDTSDANVQAQVSAERKNIAAAEEAHDVAKAAGNKLAMENALRRIETAYDKVYNILNNAPLRRDTEKFASHVEAFDRAQTKTMEATARLFEEQAGIKPLKMTERRTIASVRNVRSNRILPQFKEESVAAQETRVKQEEATGVYPAKALEELAKARAARAEVQRQIDYIDANPAAPRSEAKKRQTNARTAAVAKRKTLDEQIKTLGAAQKEVVAEAKLDTQAEKALRRERTRMVRSAGRLQEAIGEEPGTGSLYRVSNVRGKGTTPERLQAIIKQMTADWKNVPTIVMAETYDALPDNIKAQAKADDVEGFIPGVYDPATNVVYLVAENLPTDADIYATVAHEVAGHFGLRGMLGGDYTKVMDDIYAGNPAVREQADAKMKRLPSLTQQTATEEVLADMAEQAPTPATRSALGKIVKAVKDWFNKTFKGVKMSDEAVMQIVANARTYVIEGTGGRGGTAPTAAPAYRSKEAAPANAIEALSRDIVAQPKTLKQKLGDSVALQAEMQAVDMRAGLREVLKAGAAEMGDDTKFTQAMYNVLKADQKMPVAYTVMSMGPLELYKDAKGFYGVRSTNKHSAKDVFDAIADMPGTDTQSKIDVATTYMIAQRAANKGLSKLDLGELGVTQEKLDAAMAAVEADPALEKSLEAVRRAYNAYNKGQISFLAASGAIPKQVAEKLLAGGDYVPYYRVRDNGMAELNFGNNVMVSIGDIRRQPYLASLKGGETKILPLNESLPLNTFLLTDMALTNMATKNVAYALQAMGKKSDVMQIHSGTGPADPGVIRFKQEPDPNNEKDTGERWLKVETKGTAAEGVPAELLVQSLEGSHLALPEFLKLGGVAADLLRSGVTRTPLYIARQLIRDPMAAAFTGGLNYNAFTAVLKAGKEFVRMNRGTSDAQMKLLEKGLVQSGIFAGDTSDMKKMALQIASGKDQSVMDKVFAAADRAALRADAATRSLVYENAEANGLSDVEADMMTMESMNFYKRGLSPTLQYASRLIPFFNAQIQGLNVLFKAARGNMPFEEQQQIKRKFFNNAMLLVATGLVYAMAMEDDETFRNARPRDKYTNFFLPIPGLDEPIKLPIPFEAGYFYSLAVAAVDGMRAETDSKEQWKALKDMFLNSIPGYSSMGIPQIVKPAFEVWTNKNFMSGSDIESRRFQGMDTEERYNANTTELAKAMSKALPILSPIQIEHMVRGYLGVLPLAAAGAANGLFAREGKGEAPEKRLSELPVLGPAFQKKYGGGDKDVAYEMAEKAMTAKTTLNKLVAEGRREDAVAYRDENRARLAVASAAGQYRQLVGRINADLRRTQERSDLTAAEKRVRIDNLEKAADEAAKRFTQRVRQVQDQ